MTKYSRREFVKMATAGTILTASMLTGLTGYSSNLSKSTSSKKVIVFGIDGLDPNIMEDLMNTGLFSYPDEYAGKLAETIGYYYTLGMPEDTNAFGDNTLNADAFLESCDTIMDEREKMFWHEINRFKDGLLAFVFDTTDRIQHEFWSTRDPGHPMHNENFAKKYGNVIPVKNVNQRL